jgi:formate hydrogenlyase subunit 3/multisubunit Na+/H+ antiporter MnhD subunit
MITNLAILITLFALVMLVVVKVQAKGTIALSVVMINAAVSSWMAIRALLGEPIDVSFHAGLIFGEVPIRVDPLSGWFLLMMNLTTITGILYGIRYMIPYSHQPSNITLHYASYILNHLAMIGIYTIENSLAFLCVWELMAITSFMMVIFEHGKTETIRAGINYLIQSHICILFLTVGFIWVSSNTGSYDFKAIGAYSAGIIPGLSLLLFGCFFVGFAFKAGFVPFHTWLPYAHPTAPAHVSGVMSGVIIKLGIFGILRMILLIQENHLLIGYTILILSLITGVYGVMLAIIQHDLKKLLAYHSIENIGIIGIGVGIGTIGLGLDNSYLIVAGFAGALLHTFNHSLFKSLLFYGAGTVYQTVHTMNIERLGGLIKKIPQTAALFLLASLAICGLPPLNGFISEFLIYSGLFGGIRSNLLTHSVIVIAAIFSLSVIGGLAMLCFAKAFSVVFLGRERHPARHQTPEGDALRLFPKYILALLIVAIGVFPQLFVGVVAKPVALFTEEKLLSPILPGFIDITRMISLSAWALILLCLAVLGIRKLITASKPVSVAPTWGCGYPAPSHRLQYTANSFVRSFRKLIHGLLVMNKKEGVIEGVFPRPIHSETHPYDKLEALLVDGPTRAIRAFMGRFRFVQNGSVQFYISYGVVFIFITIAVPFLVNAVVYVIGLIKQISL